MFQTHTPTVVDQHNPSARPGTLRHASALMGITLLMALAGNARAQERTQITVQTARLKQEFEGLGAGTIFYEGHITSLAARDKKEK